MLVRLSAVALFVLAFVSFELYRDNGAVIQPGLSAAIARIGKSSLTKTGHYSVSTGDAIDELKPIFRDQEIDYGNGVFRYDRRLATSAPDLLVLVLAKDENSWGYNFGRPPRTFMDFLSMIKTAGIDPETVSLGLMTSDPKEYQLFKKKTRNAGFARTSIFLHPGFSAQGDRQDRHSEAVQRERRREIARLRNYLMFSTLENEYHTLWLDTDVFWLHAGLIPRMLDHADLNPAVGLLTTRCEIGPLPDYDANSFAFANNEMHGMTEGDRFVNADPTQRNATIRVGKLIEGTTDDELIELHSIGATVLYVRSSLIREGLAFTYQSVIGTTWENEGWDGLESEGMCYRLRPLGSKCFVLGGKWYSRHTDR